jgi:hypothetical protein
MGAETDGRICARAVRGAFEVAPAEVAAGRDDIHLFPRVESDIRSPHFAVLRVPGELPRIAEADGEDLRAQRAGQSDAIERSGTDEGIVRRHFEEGVRSIHDDARVRIRLQIGRQAIHVDAEDAAPEVLVDALGVVVAVVEAAGIARSPVEVTIGTETAGVDVVNARRIRIEMKGCSLARSPTSVFPTVVNRETRA